VLPALTAAPALALGVHPCVAYNLLLLSAFWFSGIAVYLLVVRLTESPRAAFVAGLAYACALYRFDHYSHLELQMMQWMPLGLFGAASVIGGSGSGIRIRAVRSGVVRLALASALVRSSTRRCTYAVFFVVYAAVIGAGLLIVHRPSLRQLVLPLVVRRPWRTAALPLVRAFVAAQPIKGERGLNELRRSAPCRRITCASARSTSCGPDAPPTACGTGAFPGVMPLLSPRQARHRHSVRFR
jgi:hypothetical protein